MLELVDGALDLVAALLPLLVEANRPVAFTAAAPAVGPLEQASPTARTGDGVHTFVFRDGLIQAQTVRYTLVAGD